MAPALQPGDRLLVLRLRRCARVNSIITLRAPPQVQLPPGATAGDWMVKRLVAVSGAPMPSEVVCGHPTFAHTTVPTKSIVVVGDHPESQDSKQWGPIASDLITGVVVRRLNTGAQR